LARTVLLADDSVTAQNMGRRILVDAGYEVITVNNGSSALKKITEEKPDLIVLDVYMPGYGGLEVCQRIREAPETARIPVLLTVGKLEPFKADEARRVRADAFIIKPFEASELLTALTSLEDKIVAQPIGPMRGTLNVPEEPIKDYGDKDRGWRSRLRIPSRAKSREAEPESAPATHPAPPAAEEFYEVKLRGADSTQPPAEINAPSAPGPETESREGQGLAIEQKPLQPVNGEERAPDAGTDRPQGDRKLVEDEVAAVLATIPDNAKASAPAPTGPRWIAEPVALAKDESALVLEQEMEKAAATTAAAVEAKRSILSHYGFQSLPAESSAPPPPETSASPPTESLAPQEAKSSSPPEQPVSAPEAIKSQEPAPVAAASVEPAGVTAVSQAQSSDVPAKEVQAYAAQASAGAVPESHVATEAAASSQASLTTSPPAAAVESSEVAAVAAQHLLQGSVTPPELTAEMVASAQSSVSQATPAEGGSVAASEAGDGDNGEAIARAVDKLLAELKPKLIEELAKKMKKDNK
jgi:CheY-like chemotaxis protein